MKFSNNGTVTFGSEIQSKGFFSKIFEKKEKSSGLNNEDLNGGFHGTLSYEQSLEISVEEMAELVRACHQDNLNGLEILDKLKDGFFSFEKELRQRAAEAIPEWRKILHEDELQGYRDSKETDDLRDELYKSKKKD